MIKQVIVMRTDLNMRKGKMIAQGAHASMKVLLDRMKFGFTERQGDVGHEFYPSPTQVYQDGSPAYLLHPTKDVLAWLQGPFTKVCVQVEGEQALHDLVLLAQTAEIPCALIQDAGKTEFGGVPTYTCCAIGPAPAEDIDKITGGLKLL